MQTRGSTPEKKRASRRVIGKPPLPTAATAKKRKAAKATGKQVAAAKQATTARVAEESAAVKVKAEKVSKRRMWTEEEDEALCKAFVNVTTDPIVGNGQKGDVFWQRVQKKMYEVMEGAEVADTSNPWPYKSVESRLAKTIGKQTTLFNTYYLQMKKEHPSGWTEQMIIDAATTLFSEVEGRPFKFGICARILHGCPKFRPREDGLEEEDDDGAGATVVKNKTSGIQGKGLPKPIGTKAAKRKKMAELDSVATSTHTDAIMAVAKASSDLNKAFSKKSKIDSMHKSVQAYLTLGDNDRAREMLADIEKCMEEDDKKPQAQLVPDSIEIQEAKQQDEEQEEEQEEEESSAVEVPEVRRSKSGAFMSVIDDALDDGDEGSSSESSHPSQPTDDSLPKKTAV